MDRVYSNEKQQFQQPAPGQIGGEVISESHSERINNIYIYQSYHKNKSGTFFTAHNVHHKKYAVK